MSEIDFANLDDASFQRLYAERIEPCFVGNETDRIAAVATFKRRLSIGAPIIVAIVIGLWFGTHEPGLAFAAAIFGGFILSFVAYSPLGKVGLKVKGDYCTAIAQAMDASFAMSGFAPPALERLKALRLLPSYARSTFEDLFHGAYKDAAYDLYEGHLEQRTTDSKGRTHYNTVFRGQLIRMAFPRKFLGVTIIRRDASVFNVFGGGEGLKKVGLEDPVFEKAFEVWGTDQVEARYLLHPVLMQRLLDLETSFKGKSLRCAFEGGDFLVAIEGGNLFEPGDLFKSFNDPSRARRIVDEIANVVRVMDQALGAQARR